MKPVAIVVLKYSLISLTAFFIIWWVLFQSALNIPRNIPYTPVPIYGLLLVSLMMTIIIIAQKELLKKDANYSVANLTLISTLICFINEFFFLSIIKSTEDPSVRLHNFIRGVAITTLLWAVLSFFTAFQIKTKNTGQLIIFILVLIALFKLLTVLFPAIAGSQ